MADFGQTDFGLCRSGRVWPKQSLAKTEFGQTDVEPLSPHPPPPAPNPDLLTNVRARPVLCVVVCVVLYCGCGGSCCVVCCVLFVSCVVRGVLRFSWVRPRFGWPHPSRGLLPQPDPPPPDRPKFRSFLSSPATFFFLSSSLGRGEFWWCLKHRGPEMRKGNQLAHSQYAHNFVWDLGLREKLVEESGAVNRGRKCSLRMPGQASCCPPPYSPQILQEQLLVHLGFTLEKSGMASLGSGGLRRTSVNARRNLTQANQCLCTLTLRELGEPLQESVLGHLATPRRLEQEHPRE